MSKANKAAQKPKEVAPEIKKEDDKKSELQKKILSLKPIDEGEGYQFQAMFELNKTFAGYVQQYQLHEFALKKKSEEIDNFKSGKWSPSLMVALNKNEFHVIDKLPEILEQLENEKKTIAQAMDSIIWQLTMKRDEFVECMIRCKSMIDSRVGNEKVNIVSHARNKYVERKDNESLSIDLEKKTPEQIKKELEDAKQKLSVK